MKVVLVHLDLGIGGAEMLVVNIACAMKELGHEVKILTAHHDPNRCFEATKKGGAVGDCIEVIGGWLPRQICGRFTAACAIVRMMYISFVACRSNFVPDVVFVDGVSSPVPIFHIFGFPVLFYCHFPDKLLCTDRSTLFKQAYRYVLDAFEENTTGCADVIVVNSKFTANTFHGAFSVLGQWCSPKVLYPTIAMPTEDGEGSGLVEYVQDFKFVFVSLNRYERKKNIMLALHALSLLLAKKEHGGEGVKCRDVLLVVAGGYDERVVENVEHYKELVDFAETNGIRDSIVFRRSVGESERNQLLRRATAVLYTPANEHFGIVPVE
ncbi:alg2, partial [Symbiodinium microadriaticum]